MALRSPLTVQPYDYIGDSNGRPLDKGQIYIGVANQDPEFNQIPVYLDAGMTKLIDQPIRTNDGFVDFAGSLQELYTLPEVYSVKVLDKQGRKVLYKGDMTRKNLMSDALAELTQAVDETMTITTESINTIRYYAEYIENVAEGKDGTDATIDFLPVETGAAGTPVVSVVSGTPSARTIALTIPKGDDGVDGKSAYQSALDNGFIGTEAEWKLYLKSDGSIQALQQFMTNPASTEVSVPDYGNIPSLQGYISQMFENGGLPATPFATKALMTASALVDGQYAMVTDDPNEFSNGLYIKDNGVWTKSSFDLVKATENKIEEKLTPLYDITDSIEVSSDTISPAFRILDPFGKEALSIDSKGHTKVASLTLPKDVDDKLQTIGSSLPSGLAWGVVDGLGKVAIGVNKDGALIVSDIVSKNNNLSILTDFKPSALSKPTGKVYDLGAELSILLSYGQSLSIGVQSGTPISDTQEYNAKMLDTGVIYSDDFNSATGLSPAIEQGEETLLSGASNMIYKLLELENNIKSSEMDYSLVLSATGKGATSVAGLGTTTPYYKRNKDIVQKVVDIAASTNSVADTRAWFWTQGETDYGLNTTSEDYKTRFTNILDAMNTDLKNITGQTEDLICIGYQVNPPESNRANPYLSIAQWEMSKDLPSYSVVCPLYQLQQPMHPKAFGYKIMGSYYGLAYKRLIIDKEDWRPLEPLVAKKVGDNIIYIKFNVPAYGLKLDTDLMPIMPNYGFDVTTLEGESLTISSVSVVTPDTVKIVVSSSVSLTNVVTYGYNGGGNLRDMQGDYVQVDAGIGIIPLHNWCLISKITLT